MRKPTRKMQKFSRSSRTEELTSSTLELCMITLTFRAVVNSIELFSVNDELRDYY